MDGKGYRVGDGIGRGGFEGEGGKGERKSVHVRVKWIEMLDVRDL